MEKRLFTSESVTEGHPDKICDQISDAVLDALYAQDPYSRVACETLTNTGFVMVMGEITTKANVDIPQIVRDTVVEIGYDSSEKGFDGNTCAVMVALDKQSADIAMGVDKALEEGYDHNRELYRLLLDDSDAKKRVLGIYMEEIYKSLNKVTEDIFKVAEDSELYNLNSEVFSRNVGRFKTISGRNIYYYGEEYGDEIKVIDNKYEKITTLNDLFEILLKAWGKNTAYPSSQADYEKDNDPTYGQCAITATIVHDLFGGTIHKIRVNGGGTHYFNKINGHYIDLTKDQFDLYNISIKYEPNEEIDREYCGKNADTLKRFNLLKENIEKLTK